MDSMTDEVSIHTPTQGVTKEIIINLLICKFQSTHPRRVWQAVTTKTVIGSFVSIHTPTQGVTNIACQRWQFLKVSIHTPTQGVTYANEGNLDYPVFQSTHPRRVWHILFHFKCRKKCFNPHTHAGCDAPVCRNSSSLRGFQSTHPRRVWLLFPF